MDDDAETTKARPPQTSSSDAVTADSPVIPSLPALAHIPAERRWREPPPLSPLPDGRHERLSMSMWSGTIGRHAVEVKADHVDAPHVISCALRRTNLSLSVAGRSLIDGDVMPGTTVLTGPALPDARAVYRADYAIMRVFVSPDAMAECFEEISGKAASAPLDLYPPHETDDRVLRHLMTSLMRSFAGDAPPSRLFLDSLSITFAAHLIGRYYLKREPAPKRKLSPLTPWRMNRAKAFVDAHLDQPISLAELSAAAGLSRMHFAAQFKAAAGMSPHMYVLQCRVHAAKRLLLEPERSIREVALAVGFKSETHFTNVFRRLVGEAPGRWRKSVP